LPRLFSSRGYTPCPSSPPLWLFFHWSLILQRVKALISFFYELVDSYMLHSLTSSSLPRDESIDVDGEPSTTSFPSPIGFPLESVLDITVRPENPSPTASVGSSLSVSHPAARSHTLAGPYHPSFLFPWPVLSCLPDFVLNLPFLQSPSSPNHAPIFREKTRCFCLITPIAALLTIVVPIPPFEAGLAPSSSQRCPPCKFTSRTISLILRYAELPSAGT